MKVRRSYPRAPTSQAPPARVAPRSHGRVTRSAGRRLATHSNPHHSTQTRIRRPPHHVHGKEGVDGSSPSEALQKRRTSALFSPGPTCSATEGLYVPSVVPGRHHCRRLDHHHDGAAL